MVNWPKNEVLGFDKNLIYLYVVYLLEYKITNSLQTFCKNHMSGKILALNLCNQNI